MQYSLKSLFLATAGVAVFFAVACTLPDLISITLMMYITLILPGATIAMIVYGRGYVRAFAIGCVASPVGPAILLTPYLMAAVLPSVGDPDSMQEQALYCKLGILGFHFINISCGLMAVAARGWIQRAKSHDNGANAKVLDEKTIATVSHPMRPTRSFMAAYASRTVTMRP
jgi:hypothetical protein